ncbi:outer membrane protein OmpA-like peptidoglycan-associated protein [Paraperlucidibaca baekdonensis]|uniref:Outer membrane protein OmpA-like peptidoglycan-associated protein n=1 Tax=Paraperlucidibaca baekdonensis TaxID=748120 RepID=A0A3E0H3E8_9GAMM|nr:OmpA family protein [Paraperlucidibaca baekdonensis]REH37596.1 outer membrane protein OmpA-like peptidoglycan-associated protein [Paraperlucidibaca baekdonensis]
MRLLIAALAAGAATLAGCTTNPYTGERQVAKGTYGAAIGAAIGCGIATATTKHGKRNERCLQGAAIGGATGGGVGVYMDVQEKKLRDRLAGVGVGVQRDKNTGIITLVMPGNITFATAQTSVRADFYPVLDAVADVLNEYDETSITVSGHTDNVGRADYNQNLSQQRASSVAGYLVNKGVAGNRVSAIGYGMNQPVASNANESGRSQNRRVEIVINPPRG